ncbi:HS12A-like protein [Mya arenaria]|uniref:HS12A-like protein n=1 Tax=Mya arenaria TaxID=6604 RepID=A0ABY7DS39_MYAAR|nr:HS12A-like protein [Mya arenaria]
MSSTWGDKKAVVAIDIGTSYTGLAYSLSGDYHADKKTEKIYTVFRYSWSYSSLNKTPTVLLLNPDKSFMAFGYDAEKRFAELAEDGIDESQYHYFKHFKMELYSDQAGISHDHLRIASEPECAAAYMHTYQLPKLSGSSKELFLMAEGDCYLILNMGNRTVDIAAHKINRQGKFEEIMHPHGGPWGGINVNLKFEQALVAVSGAATFERFRTEFSYDYLDFMRNFELKKLASPSECSNVVNITIPRAYVDCHTEENGEDFSTSLLGLASTAILAGSTFKKDKLKITNERFEMFFHDTFKHIIDNVGLLLERLRQRYSVKTIFCVGGFSDCKLLAKKIKETFSDKTVIIPPEAVGAIMRGAIIYGRDEGIIQSRIS